MISRRGDLTSCPPRAVDVWRLNLHPPLQIDFIAVVTFILSVKGLFLTIRLRKVGRRYTKDNRVRKENFIPPALYMTQRK